MSALFVALLEKLGIEIDDQLFELALTHRSFAYENGHIPTNERLEFLGDAVLGIGVTDYLYRAHPDLAEGQLAKLRSAVVSSVSLGDVARSLEIGSMIRLGRGEIATGGSDKTSILADTMEALIGAAHLTSSDGARRLLDYLFIPLIEQAVTVGAGLDWKTSLQEVCALQGWSVPRYDVVESGPDHDKRFESQVVIDGRVFAAGRGRNKKQAEQQAAAKAFKTLRAELDQG